MSDTYSLDIPNLIGSDQTDGEFTLLDYSLGVANPVSTGGTGGTAPVFQPLVVSMADTSTPGTDALLADAASGAVIDTLAVGITNAAGQVVDRIYLSDATVVETEQSDGGTTVAFDYKQISTTTFQPGANGAAGTTTTVTENVTKNDTFAAPTLPAPSTTLPSGETLLLNVPGITGPSTATGSAGDFQPKSYQFTVGPDGTTGPLVVDLGANASAQGVANLLSDQQSGVNIPTLTLDVQKTLSSGTVVTETIVLTNAVVASYSDRTATSACPSTTPMRRSLPTV